MKNMEILAMLVCMLFPTLTHAANLLSGKDVPVIPHGCEYDKNIRLFYIDVSSTKINNFILVGNDDKDFCSKIELGSLYIVDYDNFLDHRQLERSFAMLRKIKAIDDDTNVRAKILHHKTNIYYGSINDNFSVINYI